MTHTTATTVHASPEEIRRCELAGMAAYRDPARYRAPILDPVVMEILTHYHPEVGQPVTREVFKAFTRGWDAESVWNPHPIPVAEDVYCPNPCLGVSVLHPVHDGVPASRPINFGLTRCPHCGCNVPKGHVPGSDECRMLEDDRRWKDQE